MKSLYKRIVVAVIVWEAKQVLKKYKPKIVGVTGSVGKTSTKDAIYTALLPFVFVRKGQKSFNSDIGLPLTILGSDNQAHSVTGWLGVFYEGLKLILLPNHYPEWLVLEVGADHPGDIESAAKWVRPDVVVVTKLSKVPVHVEFFTSVEQVFREKKFLVEALKNGGTLILNADDEDVLAFGEGREETKILFGLATGVDIRAENYRVVYDEHELPRGIAFDVLANDQTYPIELSGTVGEHHVYHVLAALAVAQALGEDLSIAVKALRSHEPTPGRMRLVEGKDGSVILDDTYNSSPVAVTEALRALADIKATRKIAVLGDMLELGRFSVDAHKTVGQEAAKVADILITIGIRSRFTAAQAIQSGMSAEQVFEFEDSKKAASFLKTMMQKGDVVLVKGSQSVRAEHVVMAIMAHTKDKERLLVRQDKEWKKRDKKV